MIIERVSITKINPMIGKTATESVNIAITPSVAPSEREPVSPMKNFAGGMLNQTNARVAPAITPQNAANMMSPFVKAMIPNALKEITSSPPAKPSKPSVKLTAFDVDTITRMKSGMYHNPIGTSLKKGK